MRQTFFVTLLLGFSLAAIGPAGAACIATTEGENVDIARKWHEDVINRRNPGVLRDIR